jgi:hypothetical protein
MSEGAAFDASLVTIGTFDAFLDGQHEPRT